MFLWGEKTDAVFSYRFFSSYDALCWMYPIAPQSTGGPDCLFREIDSNAIIALDNTTRRTEVSSRLLSLSSCWSRVFWTYYLSQVILLLSYEPNWTNF